VPVAHLDGGAAGDQFPQDRRGLAGAPVVSPARGVDGGVLQGLGLSARRDVADCYEA